MEVRVSAKNEYISQAMKTLAARSHADYSFARSASEDVFGFADKDKAVSILTDVICENVFLRDLTEQVSQSFPSLSENEQCDIAVDAIKTLWYENDGKESERTIVSKKLTDFAERNSVINIDGFFAFRLRELSTRIRRAVTIAAKRYALKRDYGEFVAVLRYFVSRKKSRTPAVYILYDDHYVILDEHKRQLNLDDLFPSFAAQRMNDEDKILSVLVSLCPRRIYVMNAESFPSAQFIVTMEHVFEKRVKHVDASL